MTSTAPTKPQSAMVPPAIHHPRRPPAERSVSLRHSPRHRPARSKPPRNSDSSSDSAANASRLDTLRKEAGANTSPDLAHSPSSLHPLGPQTSSGESSNVEKWFEQSNNEIRDQATFADNEPPFFMRNSSSSETPPDIPRLQQEQARLLQFLHHDGSAHSLPLRTSLLQLGTDGSSTEDFRSVIDDLTIKNKKLKRRLKKYEKLHDAHLKDDKLFEVRFHALPPAKKRELEETLRKFAASLHTGGANAFPPNGYASLVPMLQPMKTVSSSHASIQNADSAYASMTASHGGSAQSGAAAAGAAPDAHVPAKLTPNYFASRRQNIHSYLHDIPEGLMPHNSPTNSPVTLSDRAKKRLVVRRLEGIFAGKDATKGGHQQPLQQQEVSQSAARDDRFATETAGQRSRGEGAREALIMNGIPNGSKRTADELADAPASSQHFGKTSNIAAHTSATTATTALEQRPTRPLDLDPQRAQVPAENIRYMRHLGFSPLDPELAASQEDGHGWIYLNFLINMAQLHIINVTHDFVRKAVEDYSDLFELSADGRKVRWRGGPPRKHPSSGSGYESFHGITSENTPDRHSPRKRAKYSHANSLHATTPGGPVMGGSTVGRGASDANKYAYTPLFFHRDSTDGGDDSSSEEEEDSESSPMIAPLAGDSSGMTSSGGMQTSSGLRTVTTMKKAKCDDGPIIFYNNANFCTDLSGDARIAAAHEGGTYTTATEHPVGKRHVPTHEIFEKRGPLAEVTELPEPMELSDNPIPASMELCFPLQSPLRPEEQPPRPRSLIELEVTGIGGVWPADNFAIAVESVHAPFDQGRAPETSVEIPPRSLPPKLASILHGPHSTTRTAQRAAVHKQIVASRVEALPPSVLPPAIQYMPFDEESQDDESDAEDAMSIAPESSGGLPPAAAPQPVDFALVSSEDDEKEEGSSDDEDEDEDEDDMSSDGSVDLLAAAREADPEAIRQKEREYDANMAERLAEDIPAGSSAATAGGGSGFASPASGVTREEYARARKEARVASASGPGSGFTSGPGGAAGLAAGTASRQRVAEARQAQKSDSSSVSRDSGDEAAQSDIRS